MIMTDEELTTYSKELQQAFIDWIKDTKDCSFTHHQNLKWYLGYGSHFDRVDDILSFEKAIRVDKQLQERHVYKVRDTFRFWIEHIYKRK